MHEVKLSFGGKSYAVRVEPEAKPRVEAYLRALRRHADRITEEHGTVEPLLLCLLAAVQALDDVAHQSAAEAAQAMGEVTVALRELAGRVAVLTEQAAEAGREADIADRAEPC